MNWRVSEWVSEWKSAPQAFIPTEFVWCLQHLLDAMPGAIPLAATYIPSFLPQTLLRTSRDGPSTPFEDPAPGQVLIQRSITDPVTRDWRSASSPKAEPLPRPPEHVRNCLNSQLSERKPLTQINANNDNRSQRTLSSAYLLQCLWSGTLFAESSDARATLNSACLDL